MKKLLLLASLIGTASLVQATTVSSGLTYLSGDNAYSWGFTPSLTSGQTISSFEIDFSSVDLVAGNSSGTGYLYTDLLNTKTTGITTLTDNDVSGDYWATVLSSANRTSLGSKYFSSVGTTLTWSYVLTADQLAALNSDLTANGVIDIGLDPDCHYSASGISVTYSTATANAGTSTVPDGATTMILLALGLGAVEVFRRRFVKA
jgi:hypothetical protein